MNCTSLKPFLAALVILGLSLPSFAKTGSLGTSPLLFIENKGQIIDEQSNYRSDIDFKLETEGLNIFIGKGQLHYQWLKYIGADTTDKRAAFSRPIEMHRIDAILAGSNPNAQLVKEDLQEYAENYFLPQCPSGATAHSYQKITYRNIYPNIDWVLYARNNELKYEFVVRPGGDASLIKIRYEGAASLQLTDGALTITSALGTVTEKKPYSYDADSKYELPSSFVLKDNVLSFNVQTTTGTLVIDPSLYWASYYGYSSPSATVECATADADGNAYMTGITGNQNNIATLFSYQYTYGGGNGDAFLVKFNMTGFRVWATYFGSSEYDEGMAIAYCQNNNSVYISGITYGTNGIATTGCHQSTNGGNPFNGQSAADAFLARFDVGGGRAWGTYYGGIGIEYANHVCTDNAGNVYITGETQSTAAIATAGAFRTVPELFYIAKFNSAGARQWGSYYVGEVNAMTCDRYNNLYIGGGTNSYNYIADSPSYQLLHGGGYTDGFLAKFDSLGTRKWGTYYGGPGEDKVMALACDHWGNLYVAGSTTSIDSITIATPGSYKSHYSPSVWHNFNLPCTTDIYDRDDGFIAKLIASTGARQWGTYYGDTCADSFTGIFVDSSGRNVWLTGLTKSTASIVTPNGYKTTPSFPWPALLKYRLRIQGCCWLW